MWNAGGRIGKSEFLRANGFFGWVIAGVVVALIATTALTKLDNALLTTALLLVIAAGLCLAGKRHLELVVRRLHDLGLSGWLSLPIAVGWLWIVAAAFAAIADVLVPGSSLARLIPAPQTWVRGLFASPRVGDLVILVISGYYAVVMGALLLLNGAPAANRYGARLPELESQP